MSEQFLLEDNSGDTLFLEDNSGSYRQDFPIIVANETIELTETRLPEQEVYLLEDGLGAYYLESGNGYYRQDEPNRGARFTFNHIMEPKMLLWLISASGLQIELVELAREASLNKKSMASSCAAIRKAVPWQTLENHINNQ